MRREKPDLTFYTERTTVSKAFAEEHISRLPLRYFSSFSDDDLLEHAVRLEPLSSASPCSLYLRSAGGSTVEITVLAFDYLGLFSLIAGLLSASEFDIESGRIFTYGRNTPQTAAGRNRRSVRQIRLTGTENAPRRRRIVDTFSGRLSEDETPQEWFDRFSRIASEVIGILEHGGADAGEKAKRKVNEAAAASLSRREIPAANILYPIRIDIAPLDSERTRLRVISEDTPFFLYALSTALALQGIWIGYVRIRTVRSRIEDEFEISDARGGAIEDPQLTDLLKISILFTKQFTYFLGTAPDPYSALLRFENLTKDIIRLPEQNKWREFLSNPHLLSDLARLLGTSRFLWEDFIRLQYENILPMLGSGMNEPLSHESARIPQLLAEKVDGLAPADEQKAALNDFKNREIYLIDLDHILSGEADFLFLSRRLTALAEAVVSKAIELCYRRFVSRYGIPKTVAGQDAAYAILGLGKLGGEALGYASDIELLFIYSDHGATSGGRESLSNQEFFERLFREAANMIETKREGIFHVDLRLRPYGQAGPVATSLESFCRYYGAGGQAYSYEKLALVRMRAIGGDEALGARVERLRDSMIYSTDSINLPELRELRAKQLSEKSRPGAVNAKFSPGGLVDLEYTVQILQIIHGRTNEALRTPRVHVALDGFVHAGVMKPEEAERIVRAYRFLRKLINGLRMLRGNAQDLFMPRTGSDEYIHLARRIGYAEKNGMTPDRQLNLDFQKHSASIRAFVEEHLGRDAIPGEPTGNAADLVLSDKLSDELTGRILTEGGLRNHGRALTNIRSLAGAGGRQETFAELIILAWDILKGTPDPDMALNNWERFSQAVIDVPAHFEELLLQPRRLEILLQLFSGSQFLADTLIRNPSFFEWITDPAVVLKRRKRDQLVRELEALESSAATHHEWLNLLRRFRKREILRIGTRDICFGISTEIIMEELSALAGACIETALGRICRNGERLPENAADRFAVFAFGKLGGKELNYSSDIDITGVYDGTASDERGFAVIMERLIHDLATHTEEGYAYRVDTRLRPYGKSGQLVHSAQQLLGYYRNAASLWEYQALIKASQAAGNCKVGESVLGALKPLLIQQWSPQEVVRAVDHMRRLSRKIPNGLSSGIDIKNGRGGIRDIEFLLQGLQLIHCGKQPDIVTAATLPGIEKLAEHRLISREAADSLKKDYLFLRRTEHFLQVFNDRQTHVLPAGAGDREALARRLTGEDFRSLEHRLQGTLSRVKTMYAGLLAVGNTA